MSYAVVNVSYSIVTNNLQRILHKDLQGNALVKLLGHTKDYRFSWVHNQSLQHKEQ